MLFSSYFSIYSHSHFVYIIIAAECHSDEFMAIIAMATAMVMNLPNTVPPFTRSKSPFMPPLVSTSKAFLGNHTGELLRRREFLSPTS